MRRTSTAQRSCEATPLESVVHIWNKIDVSSFSDSWSPSWRYKLSEPARIRISIAVEGGTLAHAVLSSGEMSAPNRLQLRALGLESTAGGHYISLTWRKRVVCVRFPCMASGRGKWFTFAWGLGVWLSNACSAQCSCALQNA